MITTSFINNSAFYIGTLLIVLSSMMYTLIQHHTEKTQNRIYIIMIVILFMQALQKIIIMASKGDAQYDIYLARVYVITLYLYQVMHFLLPMFMFYYGLFATRVALRIPIPIHVLLLVPFAAGIIMTLSNPVTRFCFTFDHEYNMIWNVGEYVAFGIGILYIFLTGVVFHLWGNAINHERKLILAFSFGISLLGVAIKLYESNVDIELLMESVTFLGIMLAVEYDEERVDAATKLYNRLAFSQDFKTFSDLKSSFYVISIHFSNLELVRRFLGMNDREQMTKIAAAFRELIKNDMVYRLSPPVFAVIIPNGHKTKVMKLAKDIMEKFESEWTERGSEFPLRSAVLYARYPDDISSEGDALLLCDGVLKNEDFGKILSWNNLDYVFNRAKLEEALHTGLTEHRFEIKYLPVYSGRTYQMCAAESMLILKDPELGEVEYDRFADMVERNGMIDRLGEYMLREVCEFLQSGVPSTLGIRYIDVRISLRQCLAPGFVDRANAIVAGSGVYPGMINFILQDVVDMEYHNILGRVINELKTLGFKMSLSGYGSEYSTMYTVFSIDFDLIRMNSAEIFIHEPQKVSGDDDETGKNEKESRKEESIIAGNNEERWVILENSIKLIHKMNRQVLVTGVQTREQLERMRSFSVDQVEGPYLSGLKTKDEMTLLKY